jgi:hypothetical protein
MKRNIAGTILFFATLLLALAAVASAQVRPACTCTAAKVAGEWGYSETGTIITPNGPVSYSSLGRFTLDNAGNYSGARTASVGGTMQDATFQGTATVNSDCTGTVTINFYDANRNLLNTVTKNLVYVDNARGARAIVTSVVKPDGSSVPTVLITDARKVFH